MRRNDITQNILKKLYSRKLLSRREIASLLQCNTTTINKKMARFGIQARPKTMAIRLAMQKQIIKISKYKLKNLYQEKELSIEKIAQKLHYCKETISRELKRHKIPLRTKAEALKLRGIKRRIKKSTLLKLYYQKKLTQREMAKILHRHIGTISRIMKGYNLKTRKASETLIRYLKNNFSGDLDEKSYLIGFRLGDLSATLSPSKKYVIINTTSTKNAQIKLFKNLFKKYGHVWISKARQDGNRVCVARVDRTFDFLLPKNDNIPKWIKENNNYFLSFLAGYTDAEGHIGIDKSNVARFQLASYDKNILKQIYKQLSKIGIKCKSPRISVKKGHIKSDGLVYRNDHWRFTINKKSSLLYLLRLLKLRLKHRKRIKNLLQAEKNIVKRNQKSSFKYFPV